MATYNRVNKAVARKEYYSGKEIYLFACKVLPVFNGDGIIQPVVISLDTSGDANNQFDRAVNSFEYYNCNSEMGYYAHYYIKE